MEQRGSGVVINTLWQAETPITVFIAAVGLTFTECGYRHPGLGQCTISRLHLIGLQVKGHS